MLEQPMMDKLAAMRLQGMMESLQQQQKDAMQRAWSSDLLRRRFRGHVPDGITGHGSAPADRAGDGSAWIDAASSEDTDGGLKTRERELRVFGCTIRKKRSIQREPDKH